MPGMAEAICKRCGKSLGMPDGFCHENLEDCIAHLKAKHAALVELAVRCLKTSHVGDQNFKPFLHGDEAFDHRDALVDLNDYLREDGDELPATPSVTIDQDDSQKLKAMFNSGSWDEAEVQNILAKYYES